MSEKLRDRMDMMRKKIIGYLMFLAVIFTLLSACSSNNDNSAGGDGQKDADTSVSSSEHSYHAENGDLREITSSADTMPSFLNDKHENMQDIYMAAAVHQELLEYIPCYCGCADSAEHQSALNCFVFETAEDGEVVWDDHGTRCGVCLETAAESINQFQAGKSIREIRDYIDEAYKEGFSTPTPTKYPEA